MGRRPDPAARQPAAPGPQPDLRPDGPGPQPSALRQTARRGRRRQRSHPGKFTKVSQKVKEVVVVGLFFSNS